jgi:hypothetical protein
MLQYTQNLFEHDRIRKQAKLILIRLLVSVPLVVITIRSFPHLWLSCHLFVTRVPRRLPHMEHELLSVPVHMCSPPLFYLCSWVSCCSRCQIACHHIFGSVLWCPLWFLCRNDARFVLTLMFYRELMIYSCSEFTPMWGLYCLIICFLCRSLFVILSFFWKTKHRATRTPLEGGELRFSGW